MDIGVLEAIRTFLQKNSLNPELREKLLARALKSERDIAEGHLLTKGETQKRTLGK
jgi:hypothetical protein